MWGLDVTLMGIITLKEGKDRNERFDALAEVLKTEEYDLVLLQEVWVIDNYETLVEKTSDVLPYHASSHIDSVCSSIIVKWYQQNCAGLLILSKHPLDNVEFTQYESMGIGGVFGNFEQFVGKGVLEARLAIGNVSVDVFNTHLVSYTEDDGLDIDHNGIRANQVSTLLERIQASDADIKIFGGDMNAFPIKDNDNSPYARLTYEMIDSFVDRYPYQVGKPEFATYGRDGNTYTGNKPDVTLDYLMHWANPSGWTMATTVFKIPEYKAVLENGKEVTISDHEALHVEYLIAPNDECKYFGYP